MSETYLLNLAYQRLDSGHVEGAIDCLRQVLGENPEDAEAHALLSICLLNMRRLHAAQHEARLALVADAHLELAHYAAARAAIAARKFRAAESHLARLLEMNPLSSAYHRALAELYQLSGRDKQCLPLLEKALQLEPESPDNLAELADYHRRRGDAGQAERFATLALKIQPSHSAALVTMGHLLLRSGKVEAAREHAIWVLREDSNDVAGLYLMSAVKARSNPFLGLWWRYNSWMAELGTVRSIVVLLAAFLSYRIAVIAMNQHGFALGAEAIEWLWLGFVLYSFAGPQIFRRSVDKELAKVRLSEDF